MFAFSSTNGDSLRDMAKLCGQTTKHNNSWIVIAITSHEYGFYNHRSLEYVFNSQVYH